MDQRGFERHDSPPRRRAHRGSYSGTARSDSHRPYFRPSERCFNGESSGTRFNTRGTGRDRGRGRGRGRGSYDNPSYHRPYNINDFQDSRRGGYRGQAERRTSSLDRDDSRHRDGQRKVSFAECYNEDIRNNRKRRNDYDQGNPPKKRASWDNRDSCYSRSSRGAPYRYHNERRSSRDESYCRESERYQNSNADVPRRHGAFNHSAGHFYRRDDQNQSRLSNNTEKPYAADRSSYINQNKSRKRDSNYESGFESDGVEVPDQVRSENHLEDNAHDNEFESSILGQMSYQNTTSKDTSDDDSEILVDSTNEERQSLLESEDESVLEDHEFNENEDVENKRIESTPFHHSGEDPDLDSDSEEDPLFRSNSRVGPANDKIQGSELSLSDLELDTEVTGRVQPSNVQSFDNNEDVNLSNSSAPSTSSCKNNPINESQNKKSNSTRSNVTKSNEHMEVDEILTKVSKKKKKFVNDPIYQLKLLLVKLFDYHSQGYKVSLIMGEKLADAVFCAQKSDDSGTVTCSLFMIQCVNPVSMKNTAIELQTFRNADFNNKKFFNIFSKCDEILRAEQKILKQFIVYSNLSLNWESFNRSGIKVLESNFIENTQSSNENVRFRIVVPEDKYIFQNLLSEKTSYLKRIAEMLKLCYEKKIPVYFHGVVAQYHLALFNENVLEIIGKKQQFKVGKFHDKFINNIDLSNSAKKLRSYFPENFQFESAIIDLSSSFNEENKDIKGKKYINCPINFTPEIEERDQIVKFYDKLRFSAVRSDIKKTLKEKFQHEFSLITEYNIKIIEMNLFKSLTENPTDVLNTGKSIISKTIILQKNTVPQKFSVNFENDETITKLKEYYNSKKVIQIKTKSINTCKLKIRHFIEDISGISIKDCIFIKFNEIASSIEMQNHISNTFGAPSTKILVIESDDDFKNEKVPIFEHTLKDILTSGAKKTLIIIGNFEVPSIGFQEDWCTTITDEPCTRFSEGSEINLFNKLDLLLHGTPHKIKDIMEFKSFTELIKNSKVFSDLLESGNKIVIGEELTIPGDFAQRFLRRNIVVSKSIFENHDSNDIFFIEGIQRSKFIDFTSYKDPDKVVYFEKFKSDKKIILISSSNNVNNIVKMNKIKHYHVLKYKAEKFIWRKSIGSISVLLKHKIDESESYPSKKIGIPSDKLSIICGSSGSGKSTYLLSIENHLQQSSLDSDFPIWTCRIRLTNKIVSQAKEISTKNSNDIIMSLSNLLHYPPTNLLVKQLFTMCLKGKTNLKLFLFVEFLEELYPDNFEFILKFINLLKKNSSVDRIFMTIQPNLKTKLESELNVFSYIFDPLLLDDKLKILTSYWARNRGSNFDFQKHAECLINTYSSKNLDLISQPMFLKMLAAIHESSIITTPPEIITLKSIDDFYQLYEKFIAKVKPMCNDERTKLQKLSLEKISNPAFYLSLCENLRKNNVFSENLTEVAISDELSHMTFADYFAAQFLMKILNFAPINSKLNDEQQSLINDVCRIIEDLIVRTSEVFLNCIFTSLKSNKKIQYHEYLFFFVRRGFPNIVVEILKYSKEIKPNLEKYLLYEASKIGNLKLVENLINRHRHLDIVTFINKDLNKKGPLEVAALNGHKEVALELLLVGANYQDVKHNFLQSLATYVASLISNQDSAKKHKYHPICELLFRLAPAAVANKDFNYAKLFNYFYIHGRKTIIEILLKEQKQNSEVFFQSVDGKSPLHYVNSSEFLNDEQRFQMTKFLLDKMKIDFKSDKAHNLRSILEAASKYGHSYTFNYFINDYDNGCTGFMKHLILENKIDNIKFLHSNNKMTYDPETGNTALHSAIILNPKLGLITFLAEKDGVNTGNNKKENALCLALKRGVDIKIIKYLVEQRANLNAEDIDGIYAWCYAIIDKKHKNYTKAEQLDLIDYFFNKTNSRAKKLPAVEKNSVYDRLQKEVEMKMEYFDNRENFDLNYDGNEPRLHKAIIQQDALNTAWAKFLITFGADVDIEDCKGRTALQLALVNKNYSIAKCLLKHNATADENLVTAFEKNHDKKFSNKEYEEVLKLLKE